MPRGTRAETLRQSRGAWPPAKPLLSGEDEGRDRRDEEPQRGGAHGVRGPESREGGQEARAAGLGQLRAQESLDGRVDVPSRGNQRLQVGLAVDEAHGVELFQLLLEPRFWRLHL